MNTSSVTKNLQMESNIISLNPSVKIEQRIDYMNQLIDNSHKRIVLIDSSRNNNLNYALITFAAAYGASLKFLQDINPFIISFSLLSLALAYFFRDFRLHQYSHGWIDTTRHHFNVLSFLLNDSSITLEVKLYCKEGEKKAKRWKEWFSPTRLIYYILIFGSILSFFIFKYGWITHNTN